MRYGSLNSCSRQRFAGHDDDFGFAASQGADGATVAGEDAWIGTVVGGVRVEKLLGRGGMGVVYCGRQEHPSREVAVKVLGPGGVAKSGNQLLLEEANLAGNLRHPAIAQVFAAGVVERDSGKHAYIIMEYVANGLPITAGVRTLGLRRVDVVALFNRVVSAVACAHSHGVVHGDLKPTNILVDAEMRPYVIDFGISRRLSEGNFKFGDSRGAEMAVGSLFYMAPEQLDPPFAPPDFSGDVYALGCVLCELLGRESLGERGCATLSELRRVVRDDLTRSMALLSKSLDTELVRIIRRCLEPEKQNRYPTAEDLASDLKGFLGRVIGGDGSGQEWQSRLPLCDSIPAERTKWRIPRSGILVLLCFAGVILVGKAWKSFGLSGATITVPSLPFLGRSTENSKGGREHGNDRPEPPFSPLDFDLLTADEAAKLRNVGGILTVRVRQITPAACRCLANSAGHLELTVSAIDTASATALASHRGGLSIVGFAEPIEDVVRELSRLKGGSLCLDDVQKLTVQGCRYLANYPGWLNLNGMRRWPKGGIFELAKHRGGLSIGVHTLTVSEAEALSQHRGTLYIVGLDTLPDGAARSLLHHNGTVHFSTPCTISESARQILNERKDFVVSPGVSRVE